MSFKHIRRTDAEICHTCERALGLSLCKTCRILVKSSGVGFKDFADNICIYGNSSQYMLHQQMARSQTAADRIMSTLTQVPIPRSSLPVVTFFENLTDAGGYDVTQVFKEATENVPCKHFKEAIAGWNLCEECRGQVNMIRMSWLRGVSQSGQMGP